jgi:HlyD family secretion protein
LFGVAAAGVTLGVVMVVRGAQSPTPAKPIVTPEPIPFLQYIAGSGVIEASSDDIQIATPISGVVEQVFVKEQDQVQIGDPLFRLEDRDFQAQLRLSEAELQVAKKQVAEAISELDDKQNKLNLVNKLSDKRAISQEEVDNRRNAVRLARAKLATAHSEVERREAQVNVIATDIHRMTVRSPIAGEILQVNIHPGEYAQAGSTDQSLMILGNTSPLHVRVDINEHDAWRFDSQGKAVAVPRGNPQLQIPLTFVRVEPYIVPKRSLTGDSSERVDTRVLQVIYEFEKGDYPVYVGQQVDVSMATTPDEKSEDDSSPVAAAI